MRRIWCLAILMATSKIMSAQYTDEISALRFSQETYGNSARTLGAAGAFGAIGADIGSTSINPAGVGIFRSSNFSFSPSFNVQNTSASYLDGGGTGQAYNLNGGNWGVNFCFPIKDKKSAWKFVNFAINTNRLNTYNSQVSYSGTNTNSSYSQLWVQEANTFNNNAGVAPNSQGLGSYFPATAWLAYNAYLINPNSSADSTHYYSIVHPGNLLQSEVTSLQGKMTETNLTIGANYNDKVYIGLGLGIRHIHFYQNNTYSEVNKGDTTGGFNNFNLMDAISTDGYGYNLKLGTIIRLNKLFRVGVSIQTPTWYNVLTDNYGDSINSTVRSVYHSWPPANSNTSSYYSYTLITPFKATLSGAITFGTNGFISIDYTYIPYNTASYNFNQNTTPDVAQVQSATNSYISKLYTGSSNIRLGGEYRYDVFSLRAGVAYYGSPYSNNADKPAAQYDQTEMLYSLGAGVRIGKVNLDLAYAYQTQNYQSQPYYLNNMAVQPALIKTNTSRIMATLGMKF